MAKNSSSASMSEIEPAGKPKSSFITDSAKTGEFGDNPIRGKEMTDSLGNSPMTTEDFGSKDSKDTINAKEISPQAHSHSTTINTSALK